MTVEAEGERSARSVEGEAGRYRATLAWRGEASGRALVYFVAVDGDGPAADDRRDRRAPLEANRRLRELPEDELSALLERATSLTGTERRFRAPDGRLWLAQSAGPVWADEDPAEGSTGTLFTALEGDPMRLRGPGAHVGELEVRELVDLWRRAGSDEGGEEDGDAGA